MPFTTPSSDLENKTNVNPSQDRSQEATAEDFSEIVSLIVELQTAVTALQNSESPNPFYGRFTSMAALISSYPTGEENAWAIIDAGSGITPQIAAWDNIGSEWEITGAVSTVATAANLASLPPTGDANTLYVTLDTFSLYLWSSSAYNLLSKPPTLLNLSDTPNSYSSQALKLLRVNAAGTATEFVSPSSVFDDQRKRKVINIVDNTSAPPTEVSGDRYIIDDTGSSHANWDGAAALSIVEFDGTTWQEAVPEEGWVVYVDSENKDARFINDGSPEWELVESTITPPASKTGTTMVFTEDALYNEAAPLTSGVLTFDATGAVKGVGILFYIDKYVPTITSATEYIKTGSFDATKFHTCFAYYDGQRILLVINQSEYLDAPVPTVLAGNEQIVFNDFNVPNAESYEILFSTTNDIGTASAVPSYNGTDTDYTHTGLTNGTTYYYWFKASGGGYLDSDYQTTNETPSNAVAWVLNNFGYNSQSFTPATGTLPLGVFFEDDGTQLFILESGGNDITSFPLSVAWDLTTVGSGTAQGLGITGTQTGLFFKPDGTKVFFVLQSSNALSEATLSTAWDITTMGSVTSSSGILQATSVSLFFKDDGTQVYVTNKANSLIHSFTLSTAWDITTASANNSFDATAQDTGFHGIFFKDDGTKMYIHGESNDTYYEYDLSTAWDITTASYATSLLDTSSEDSDMRDVYIKPDGLKLYSVGISTDKVYEYIAT